MRNLIMSFGKTQKIKKTLPSPPPHKKTKIKIIK